MRKSLGSTAPGSPCDARGVLLDPAVWPGVVWVGIQGPEFWAPSPTSNTTPPPLYCFTQWTLETAMCKKWLHSNLNQDLRDIPRGWLYLLRRPCSRPARKTNTYSVVGASLTACLQITNHPTEGHTWILDTLKRMDLLAYFLRGCQEGCQGSDRTQRLCAMTWTEKAPRCVWRGVAPETHDLSQCHPGSRLLLDNVALFALFSPGTDGLAQSHSWAGSQHGCPRNPSPFILPVRQVFNGLRLWAIATHSGVNFRCRAGIMIPINDDIIHAAKIRMPPAKTFPCRGCNPYLLRNPSL